MTHIQNTQGITTIKANKRISLYCPLGKDYYTADLVIEFGPDKIIMDYCELDKYLNNLSGLSLIIEDLIDKVFTHLQAKYKPKHLKVSCKAYSNTHLDVEVIKCGKAQ